MTCTVDPAWLQAYMATMAALWYCSRSKSTELWRHNSPMRWRKKWGRLVSEVYNSTHICAFYIVYNMTNVGHSYIKDACINKYIYIYNYTLLGTGYSTMTTMYMAVDPFFFICKRPFFASSFCSANLSRTLWLSFAEAMLSNNCYYEDSIITSKSHQIITDNFFVAL